MKKFLNNWWAFIAVFVAALLLILIANAQAQNQNTWYRMRFGQGPPEYNPTKNQSTGHSYTDTTTYEVYFWQGGSTQAWYKSGINLKGPQGEQGNPGADGICPSCPINPGNGIYITPDQYGAVHADKTFSQNGKNQQYINENYPGIGATVNDNIDWAAWQMAVNNSSQTGQPIDAFGNYYFGSKGVLIKKDFYKLDINGNLCNIYLKGSSTGFYRDKPSNNSEALVMINARYLMDAINIYGTTSNIGIEPGPTYTSSFTNINGNGLKTLIHLRFGLNTSIDKGMATNCINGWIADMGNWTGADNSNSQSNHTSFNHLRFYAASNSNVAFGIYAASGCSVTNGIIEGVSVQKGIDFDAYNSNVVKDFTINNVHFEAVNGASIAAYYVRMAGGIVTLNKTYGQYASILLDCGSTSGNFTVIMENVPYWVLKNGKAFRSNNASWVFNYNDNPFFSDNLNSLFEGSAPPSSRIKINKIPR